MYASFDIKDIHYIDTQNNQIITTGYLNNVFTFLTFKYINGNWIYKKCPHAYNLYYNDYILTEKSNYYIMKQIIKNFPSFIKKWYYFYNYTVIKFMLLKQIIQRYLIDDILYVIVSLSD